MEEVRMSRALAIGAAVLLAALAAASCSDDETNPAGPDPDTPFPHAVPPAATMEMDVSDLAQEGLVRPAGVCHAISAAVVGWVHANVAVRLAIPVAVFRACAASQPVYLGDSTWRWTATGGSGGQAWTGELTAVVQQQDVETVILWEMRISGAGHGYDRVLWFEGESDAPGRRGAWTYYDPASASPPEDVVRCAWEWLDNPSEDRELEFENVHRGDPDLGDVLRYAIADSIASVSFHDESEDADSSVTWDLRTGEGRSTNAVGETCCWGPRPLYPDIPCP
jgi:hypothetical protein